jgi:rSAM/selenodomain-associated transferase 2
MVSIIIPTLNAEPFLPSTLAALVPAAISGLVRELVIVDGGSDDATLAIADGAGAAIICTERGRGRQLRAGGRVARSDWLLFLHADTVLEEGWMDEVEQFIEAGETARAAAFRFALDDRCWRARLLETIVAARCKTLGLAYGDQGLLIARRFYEQLGGFADIPLMEDVDLVRKIGRARLHFFHTRAITSAERYEKDGYLRRMAKNARCLAMWYAGSAPEDIVKKYR